MSTNSVVQLIDEALETDLTSTSLQSLFTHENVADGVSPMRVSTPSRAASALNWGAFGQLATVMCVYTLDSHVNNVTVGWDNDIFKEVRLALTDSDSMGGAPSSVNYHVSVPIIKLYKEYITIINELAIENHPLKIAMTQTSALYNSTDQKKLRTAIFDCLASGVAFRKLQDELMKAMAADFEPFSEAELKLAEFTGDKAADLDEAEEEALKTRASELSGEASKRKEELKQLRQKLDKLEATVNARLIDGQPAKKRVADLEESISHLEKEVKAKQCSSNVTAQDVAESQAELQRLEALCSSQEDSILALEQEVQKLDEEQSVLNDHRCNGIKPIKEFCANKLAFTMQNFSDVVRDGTLAQAALASASSKLAEQQKQLANEKGQSLVELEEASSVVARKAKDADALKTEIDFLNSEEYESRREHLKQEVTRWTTATTEKRKQDRIATKDAELRLKRLAGLRKEWSELLQEVEATRVVYAKDNAKSLAGAIDFVNTFLNKLK